MKILNYLLKPVMHYQAATQSVIQGNISHANEPGFKAEDPVAFGQYLKQRLGSGSVGLKRTHPRHLGGSSTRAEGGVPTVKQNGPATMDGNNVVLEEEMWKASQNRDRHTTATYLYRQMVGLMQRLVEPRG